MKRCFFIGLALFACSMLPAQAQTSTDVNEGVRVTADASTGAQVLTWWGKAGRTYFVQQSYDLITWTYVPVVSDGGAAVDGLNFASTDNRQFWRLQFTDVSTGGLSGAAADFDGDGVSNLDELNSGTAPFNPDTDDDGFSDGTEALAGTNPTSADSNPVTDLSDEPLLSVTFLQSGNGQNSYEASSSVVQSEFYPDSWLVHIFRDLPGDTYTNRTVVNGSMPAVPDLPARPVAGSGSDVWGSSYSVGRDMLIYLLRIVNADTSGPGGETGAPVISHGSWLEGSAIKYKFTVQYPSMKDRTVRFMTQKTKQAVVYDPALPGFNYPSALTVTDSQVCTLMLPAEATETAETILQPDEAEDNTQTTATVAKALFITPAGDPVSSPVDGGTFNDPNNIPDGANEFTFSADTPGVLKLKFKVRKPDLVDQSATDQAKYTFDVDAIGSSVLSWPTANTGGKATVSGEYLTATATFTGLPQNNTDFGTKTVRLMYDGGEVAEQKFEVFYNADLITPATNHPGGQPGSPNWFYYWSQVHPNAGAVYEPPNANNANAAGETPAMYYWTYFSIDPKTKITLYDKARLEGRAYKVGEYFSGIDRFICTLLHEERHVDQIARADQLLTQNGVAGTPWRLGWSFKTPSHNHWDMVDGKPGVAGDDDDLNGIIDDLLTTGPGELGHGPVGSDDLLCDKGETDWPAAWSKPQTWPNVPLIEADAIHYSDDNHDENESARSDWGNPGKNHKTLDKYDD